MVRMIEQYGCGICSAIYDTLGEAEKCEATGIIDIVDGPVEVGDIVTCGGPYGWWDGDRSWTVEETDKEKLDDWTKGGTRTLGDGSSRPMEMLHPKWIVIGKTPDGHDKGSWGHLMRYELYTPSSCQGQPRVANTSQWHCRMKVVGKATPAQLEAAQREAERILAGKRSHIV